MTITAEIITDSMSNAGIRLTTFQLRYPRFIHAELMTHRVFSRNASSSRAIPVKRMMDEIKRDPAMPTFWGSNQPGMQARDELEGTDLKDAKNYWIDAMWHALGEAEKMVQLGLHKQIANRILEPWAHINVVVTSSQWNNWYELRRHKDAQPEIKVLADAMWEAHETGPMPISLAPGEWHLPYIDLKDRLELSAQGDSHALDMAKCVSVARCARVSYLTHDGRQTSIDEDMELYQRLVGSAPLHASPAEHQATPDTQVICPMTNQPERWEHPELHGNLRGWIQLRKTLPGEFIPE